ncbi:MAG: DUF47 family protein [Candidatus Methanomethylophilaceae archaeon]|nr:DUF47 family protein [Candidatus Methanomethylophilaceae archaeon]
MSDEAKNLLGWFGKRKSNVVHNGMEAHAISVLDCVLELGMALRAMGAGEGSEASRCIDRLIVNEREADAQEDELSVQLSIGDLSSQEREDLLHFVRKTDHIANWCKEAALHIQLIRETGAAVPAGIWALMVSTASDLETEVKFLVNGIHMMGTGEGDIRTCIEGVKSQESLIDNATYNLTKEIHMSDMDYRATMLSSKIVDSLEQAADTCKGCADTIGILLVSRGI